MNIVQNLLIKMYHRGNELGEEISLEYVARQIETPQEILADLSKHSSFRIRREVAMNPNASEDLLIYLSKDKNYDVRYFTSTNINCPEEVKLNIKKLNMCM